MAEFEKVKDIPAEKPLSYRWEPDVKFILTGLEFDHIYNGLRANLNDPNFIRVAATIKALETADSIFKQGLEAGVIKPVYPEPKVDTRTVYESDPELKIWEDAHPNSVERNP